ncbi:MAG: metal-dependent hydrolase [Flavobacteriales bacterium]|nr:metal-dependent hydrolase [Flavobacteriales bacterium]MCB9167996.1 metal-dependent hydrolase [Flavobacteriales bacterium]
MDTLTHIAVGACIGEIFLGGKLGRKALLWGALAQSIPDVDVVSALWTGPAEHLLAHRGFTHSILFAALTTPFMALIAHHWHRAQDIPFSRFAWFFGTEILLHIGLDALNSYGTGWFEPFSHERVMFNVIYVADPFFAIAPGVALLVLLVPPWRQRWRAVLPSLALVIAAAYLALCAVHKYRMEREVRRMLQVQGITYDRLLVTPTPLNNWLWYIVTADDSVCRVGFRSVLDRADTLIMHAHSRNMEALGPIASDPQVRLLRRFAQGFDTVERRGDELVFNDLRFGQIMGWRDPGGPFVFHWSLTGSQDRLTVQRGRFTGWDKAGMRSFIRRIRGDQATSRR